MATPDPTQLKKTKDIRTQGIAFCITRHPESGRLYYGSSDFQVYEIDVAAEKPEATPLVGESHQSYVTGLTIAGAHLVSGSYDGRLIWWNLETRERIRDVLAHDRWIRRVVATPDGQQILSVGDDMVAQLWNAQTGEAVRTFTDHEPMTPHHHPSMLYAAAVSPDGQYLATGDKTGHVAVWEVATGEKLGQVEAPTMYTWDPRARRHSIGGIRSLAFSPDSKLLAVGGMGQVGNIDHLEGKARVEVFTWRDGQRTLELEAAECKGLVEQIVFHPSGEWFAAAGGDNSGFVTIYNAADGKVLSQEKAGQHVHGLVPSDDFATLYTAGHDQLMIWTLQA